MIPLMYPATFVFKNSSSAYIVLMGSSVLIGFVTTSATLVLQLTEQTDSGLVSVLKFIDPLVLNDIDHRLNLKVS